MNQSNFALIITGPTATGKSNIALQLANDLPIEIINADIGSFYKKLTIGTAKPDWKNQTTPHHFFDIIEHATNWTAPEFRDSLTILIDEIWSRGNIPVIVGGSAFYIQSFFYKNQKLENPSQNLLDDLEKKPADILWKELYKIDPERAGSIDKHDHYRLVRALSIWHTQGKKPSECQQIYDPISPFYCMIMTRDRDELYSMINHRVESMIQSGWVDEVTLICDDQVWVDFIQKKKIIGYDLLIEYLLGNVSELSFDEIIACIAQKTRNYAKRQITFLKKLEKSIRNDSVIMSGHKCNSIAEIETYNLTYVDMQSFISDTIKKIKKLRG